MHYNYLNNNNLLSFVEFLNPLIYRLFRPAQSYPVPVDFHLRPAPPRTVDFHPCPAPPSQVPQPLLLVNFQVSWET